ncbi:hypothetical protein [Hymenobacter cellulosilyticus]|uniref:Uncharacterized protein n=1 Tax=Hymenobacter cellulosilyticus TaxID=2932248 RepID=A0A8T9QCY9_9BACT|nr:hypothetical protein [Hymenobacter cellulosilyticus]UOQ74261.1 hypothetical protein MUN79_10475 [Hymenobacter cellulosilyticus]
MFKGAGLAKLAEFQSELYRQQAGEFVDEKKAQKLAQNPLLASHFYLGYVAQQPGRNLRKPIAEKVTWVTE